MRWYLAASFSRQEEMRGYRTALLNQGEEVQARWITDHTSSVEHDTDDQRTEDAIHDIEDITKCEAVMFFSETPDAPGIRKRGGRHVEYGIALALNKRVVIIGERENVFHYLPSVEIYSDFNAFMEEGLL